MLGFFHIAWALYQVTKGDGKAKFMWGGKQKREFYDLKNHLFSAPVVSFPNLQQPFEIETDAFDYVVGTVLTQDNHLVAYHSETLSYIVRKYPTDNKEMYSIVQYCRQWKHYILGKETIIHIDHKPLQFIQTQGKLQNDWHQKWSTYLQWFHLNINYKIGISNCVTDCLSRPLVDALTTMLHSYGHEASEWPLLYQQDPDFATIYQLLRTGTNVIDFHIQDGLLCHLFYIYVPTRECANLILEAHYIRMAGHFGVEKTLVILQKHFYWPKLRWDVSKYIRYCTACAFSNPFIKK